MFKCQLLYLIYGKSELKILLELTIKFKVIYPGVQTCFFVSIYNYVGYEFYRAPGCFLALNLP